MAKRNPRHRKGTSAVEFAMVSPILFLVVFAGIEFVRANIVKHTANNATFAACREVIVPGGTKAEAIAEANQVLAIAGIRDAEITLSPDTIDQSTASVKVSISVPMNSNSWGISSFLKNRSIVAETELMTERAPAVQAAALPSQQPPPEPEPEPTPEPGPTPEPTPEPAPEPEPTPEPPRPSSPRPVLL